MLLGRPPGANLHLRPPQQIVNRPSQSPEVVPGKPSASLHPVWRKRHPPVHEATGGLENLPLRSIPSGASAIHPFTRPRAATGFPGTTSKLHPSRALSHPCHPERPLRCPPEGQRRISKPTETLQSAGGGEKCSNKRLRPNHFPPPPALLPLPPLSSQVRTCDVKVRPTSLKVGRQAHFTPFFAPVVHKTGTSGAPGSLNGISTEERWRYI